jgi:hypothetical protein
LINNCSQVVPSQPLSSSQKLGLEAVSRLSGGRDVVLAIDLTESVGLNDEGRLRLRQIVKDTLQSGDTVYIVSFAAKVNPLNPNINLIAVEKGIKYNGKAENIDRILQAIPLNSSTVLRQTDIQAAELATYRGLAQINQCRLAGNESVKPQSVVWLTDAPLFTKAGITSKQWQETPANSPFRQSNSSESQARQKWLEALPYQNRSIAIATGNNKSYNFSVVDIPPTVQEFCTPAPGGKETCLVNGYLLRQLWLPSSILILLFIASGFYLKYWLSLRKKWCLKISFDSDRDREEQILFLANGQKIAIGGDGINSIECRGMELRGYLQRRGNKIYLQPSKLAPLFCRDREVSKELKIESNYLNLNCPDEDGREFAIAIKINRY